MPRLRVAPIVEGHGEDAAIRILLQRIWAEVLSGDYLEVIKPIRTKRTKITGKAELARVIDLAALKLGSESTSQSLILILLDAEEDCPKDFVPQFLRIARELRADMDIACVLANPEYETWFVAAAPSLGVYLKLAEDEESPPAPEGTRNGKRWIQSRFRGVKYSPSVDQPAMTAAMDLLQCRAKCPSFDKLCRELEARMR
jgi:hypothetical protein